MRRRQSLPCGTLKRGENKLTLFIMFYNEPHGPIAKGAFTIKEYNLFVFIHPRNNYWDWFML